MSTRTYLRRTAMNLLTENAPVSEACQSNYPTDSVTVVPSEHITIPLHTTTNQCSPKQQYSSSTVTTDLITLSSIKGTAERTILTSIEHCSHEIPHALAHQTCT